MSYLTIMLLCLASYVVGGVTGMATLMLLRQAKRQDRGEKALRAATRRMNGRFMGT
jgi:hypothetical protein